MVQRGNWITYTVYILFIQGYKVWVSKPQSFIFINRVLWLNIILKIMNIEYFFSYMPILFDIYQYKGKILIQFCGKVGFLCFLIIQLCVHLSLLMSFKLWLSSLLMQFVYVCHMPLWWFFLITKLFGLFGS